MKRNRDPPWYVVDWVSTRSQAWLAREWLQIPSWLSCQSLTRFFAHRSHYSAIPACKPYYVLHGISALEVAVVVLYLSRYQHHDENLAGKLSQSWSEKSSGSTRKRMDDAFKSLWSVALELELILALILMQFFSVQQHKRKRSSVAKLKEKKRLLGRGADSAAASGLTKGTHLSYVEPLSFLIHLQLLECVSNLSGAFFATQQ